MADPLPSRPRLIIPYVVLGVSLLISLAVSAYVALSTASKDHARFENAVARTADSIQQRIDTYVNMLKGGAGLFATADQIKAEQFRAYVARLGLLERYPGIQGVGVSARVSAPFRDQLIERMHHEGDRDFHIIPDHERDEYHAIIYLEPQDPRNKVAIGYDMFTEPTRRAAMELARDTGEPATTGKVRLIQEINPNVQAGFLIYIPVYRFGGVPETVELRRLLCTGYVYAPFRADDFLRGVFPDATSRADIEFTIYDGSEMSRPAQLHQSAPMMSGLPRFSETRTLRVPERVWTVEYRSVQPRGMLASHGPALLVLGVGGAVSCLLFALSAAQSTAQQRSEDAAYELRASERALRASEGRFRRLVESNLIGVVFSTTDGRIIDGNDEYYRIVGRRKDDALAGKLRWDEMTAPGYEEIDRIAVAELHRRGVCTPFEKEFVRPDGTRVPVLVGVAMLEGEGRETVAMYVDLTARMEAEREIRIAKETAEAAQTRAEAAQSQAEVASRLKDDFLATVSHELRTPLNAILGWSQLLRTDRISPEDHRHGLETIERSAKSQAQLIDDLLDVSRIVAGKLRLEVKPVQLGSVIDAALASVRPAAEAKNVRLVRSVDPDAERVLGDAGRLQQIVWNLLSNAVKFTPRDGEVEIALRRSGDNAEIVVSDTGIGIETDFLPHVFERFRQADATTTRRFGGLGLGLGIVRHLTELHGGTVHAHSNGANRGASFTVTLPLAVSQHNDEPGTSIPSSDISLQGLRVLLVEDDPDARELVTRILHDRGAHVATTSSASEAMDSFRAIRPDILISDIGMPDLDGYGLIARVRAMEAEGGRRVPAIALTALARPEDRKRALLAGFQVHVPKPVEATELTAVIASLTLSPLPSGGED